ncbi:MAG TPA: DUF58 domain-containing protein [Vicinamibacterales bacterium]|nr:DUF58 domain-containing protein [Vicinamibacterales bacterium]
MRSRAATWADRGARNAEPLISLSDITEVELLILKRMREFTIGDHASRFHGSGFDFVGLRDYQPGDRFESIDWAQSSLTNFSPMIIREFEQPSTSSVVMVADRSLSTRCGIDGVPIATIIARTLATIGLSAVFFQDSIGLVTFDHEFSQLQGLRPRIGKGQVIHCLDAYQFGEGLQELRNTGELGGSLSGFMRKTSMVPVISDFLFDNVEKLVNDLAHLNSLHDVFLGIVDAAFAFELPGVSAGWIEAFDVESGKSRVMSRRELAAMAGRVRVWQDDVAVTAKKAGIDALRLESDPTKFDIALLEWVAERRLRRR